MLLNLSYHLTSMDFANTKKWISKNFTLNGYSVRAEVISFLASKFVPLSPELRQTWMDKITRKIQDLNIDSLALDKHHIEICLQECMRKQPSTETIFNVISSFEIPSFTYNSEKNKFVKDVVNKPPELLPHASIKGLMYRRRYTMLMQRVRRHHLFRRQAFGESGAANYELRTAEWYLCCSEKIENAVMIGLLVQRGDGHYDLEDLTGSVKLDLSICEYHPGLFTENCFVLVDGVYDDKVFLVKALGSPPAELAKKSRPYFGDENVFGGPSLVPLNQSVSLLKVLNNSPDDIIVFLSDVWLDDLSVIKNLKFMFEEYADFPPIAFVFMGNFLSMQASAKYAVKLKAAFKNLGEMIAVHPKICERSQVILVPGPSDPGSPLVLPRPPLPDCLTEDIRQKVPKLVLASNPCRIQYCIREIVVIRENVLTKMCRNLVYFPPKTEDFATHFAKTLTCQATLTPLPLHVSPTYWNFSHAMDLYPLPDIAVVGDEYEPFIASNYECFVTNPGSFGKNKFSFLAYKPATHEVDSSAIPQND